VIGVSDTAGMTKIIQCDPAEWIPKIRDLLDENWAETGFDFDFDPDISAYRHLYESGYLFALAAIDQDEVVGFCTVTVVNHPHSKQMVVASNDALFVRKIYRNGTTAGRLILAAEAEAKARGALRFTWHCRAGTPLSDVLTRHGYQPVDIVVMKGL